jgi:hypothetical protein
MVACYEAEDKFPEVAALDYIARVVEVVDHQVVEASADGVGAHAGNFGGRREAEARDTMSDDVEGRG